MAKHKALLHILWDHSEIWGLIAARAARVMGLPYRLARAADIASGLLERERPSLVLVPGGNARHKAESLGQAGTAALKEYVRSGGRYLGFCGGAGLALDWGGALPLIQEGSCGLGLCPWKRGRFDERMQHFMSGHLHVSLPAKKGAHAALVPDSLGDAPALPVWWPGRFAEGVPESVTVLAAYERPAQDFWLADLPIAELPPDIFSDWSSVYGVSLTPTFLAGQPCVVYGEYGQGAYVLSYSHLETPDSPQANAWLALLFKELGGLEPRTTHLPAWCDSPVSRCKSACDSNFASGKEAKSNAGAMAGEHLCTAAEQGAAWDDAHLAHMLRQIEDLLCTGMRHGLLFARTDWLMGWRFGLPGANLNNLWAALRTVRELEPDNAALAFWREHKEALRSGMDIFYRGCVQYLLAERLGMTLAKALPEALPQGMLRDQRESLFGPPMQAGGLYKDVLETLDELAWLQLNGKR